eukprot:TRINITY_DN26872_c0_g1_i1.p1 TRINITY_DN26872_c0_g1~~TRINITY_DN26872_c0_g1_i1.p1  ORF type:complete len:350 (+),score=51.36 TRINITY_DN26872_c0_g1_i1:43-1050(+)
MVSIPTCKDVSDEHLDTIGNYFAMFLKRLVVVACIIAIIGFLGCIATTVSPPAGSAAKLDVSPVDVESKLVPVEKAPSTAPQENAVWVTSFTDVDVKTHRCREMSTGIQARCVHTDTGLSVSIIPTSGKWLTWQCEACDCRGCPDDAPCNGTKVAPSCFCQEGCICNEQDPGVVIRVCTQTLDGSYTDYPPKDTALTTEYQLFATLTNMGYLFFLVLIFVAELEMSKFAAAAKLITFWPVRASLQLFLGVQLVNTTTTQATSGHNNDVVHNISLVGGWFLVFSGLAHLIFYGIYVRPIRPAKFCGILCIVILLIIVPIGAAIGTTASKDGGGSDD